MAARAAAIVLLVLVHVALFLAFNPRFAITKAPPANEIVLSLPRRSAEQQTAPAIAPRFATPQAPVILPPVLPPNIAQSIATPSPPNIIGLGRSLFGCDLANSRNLPADARANCTHLPVPPATAETGLPKTSKALQSARWTAALVARHMPLRVPCTGLQQLVIGDFGAQKSVTVLMGDPLCLLNHAINGFGPPK